MNSKSFSLLLVEQTYTNKQNKKGFQWIFPMNWICWWKFLWTTREFKNEFLCTSIAKFEWILCEAHQSKRRINNCAWKYKSLSASHRINWTFSPERLTMESLVRFLIGFVLIYQLLPIVDCKVIKQRSGHEKGISESEVNYERSTGAAHFNSTLGGSQKELNKTSIRHANAGSLSGSNINFLTHMWVTECFSLFLFLFLFIPNFRSLEETLTRLKALIFNLARGQWETQNIEPSL